MAVYVDKLRNWGWRLGPSCHMIADTNEELHAMAAKIGLKRAWFQTDGGDPHYDLTASRRVAAVKAGAVELGDRPFHEIIKRWRADAVAAIKACGTKEEQDAMRRHLFR